MADVRTLDPADPDPNVQVVLDELGWLRGVMQSESAIRMTVMRIVINNGYGDLGVFAYEKQEAFLMLADGIHDLIDQDDQAK